MAARSAEREQLAEACARYKAAQERIAKLQLAERCAVEAVGEADQKHEAALAALEEAKSVAPRRGLAILMGEIGPDGPSVDEALEALAGARRGIAEAEDIREEVRAEIRRADGGLPSLGYRVRDAIASVLAAEPAALEALWQHGMRLRGGLQDWQATCEVIGLARLPNEHRWQSWHASNLPGTKPTSPLAERWRLALSALEAGDVDAPLPLLTAEG